MNMKEENSTKVKLTPAQQKLFSDNFNRQAYEDAKKPIQEAIAKSKSFFDLWDNLSGYEHHDVEYTDKYTIVWCEVELNKKHMKTKAGYVGVCFFIYWNDETKTGEIGEVELYSNEETGADIADLLCYIDPETCEVTEWLYDVEPEPDIDDKQ